MHVSIYWWLSDRTHLEETPSSGLYYKHITTIYDASRTIRMRILSDATTWSVIYERN
jgi:hypothetical protein